MHKPIALITAVALLALPASPAAAEPAKLITEQHYSQDGFDIDLYVTEGDEGVLAEATIVDPATGDSVDFWAEGDVIRWQGIVDGELVEGSMPKAGDDPQEAVFCLTPATAILCIGAFLIATQSGCKHSDGPCGGDRGTEVPGGAGGVPGAPDGGGDGGGGDSDEGDGDGD